MWLCGYVALWLRGYVRHGSVLCRALPGHTSFINSMPCCAVSWTYLSGLRCAVSYARLVISVLCHAVSFFSPSSPCHAVLCLCFCRSVACHALPAGGRPCKRRLGPCLESVLGSSVSSRVMRVSVSFCAGPFSRLITGGPCCAVSYVEVASSSRVMPCHITCVPGRCRALP